MRITERVGYIGVGSVMMALLGHYPMNGVLLVSLAAAIIFLGFDIANVLDELRKNRGP